MYNQNTIPILSPKLQIPPPRLQLVSRRRLLEFINSGLHRKLTLISAPAGYGKTTLLSEWASQCDQRLAWVTLAVEDNDTDRFLAYLISALQTADSSLSRLEVILGGRFSLQPMSLEAILAILVNQLSSFSESLVVVLDDYQFIEDQGIHNFVNSLLENLPSNIHLIISTRTELPLRLARLRAKDQLNEITEKDLRFTLEEAERFLDIVMGLRLTDHQIAELEDRTEGWVTGLQLVGLSLKDRERPGEIIKTLTGTHRYILDYLVEEVFSDLPPVLQTFLLMVSILEGLSPGLCDAVTMDLIDERGLRLQSKKILEFMDASNLFVVPLDSQRQWYRFHPLFAEFLRDRFESQEKDQLSMVHHRAAAWYADHGFLSEAVKHCFSSNDFNLAADLIQAQAKEMLRRGEISTLYRWIEALPEEIITTRPQLGLTRAWVMLMHDPIKFREVIDRQIHHISEGFGILPEDLLGALAESAPDSPRRSGLGELAMLQAFIQRDNADVDQTITIFKAAFEYLPESQQLLRGFTLAGLASTYARQGAIRQAEKAFGEAAQISLAVNSIYGYVACIDWQATMQAEQGQLTRAATAYRQAIEILSSQGQIPLPLSGHVYVGLAGVLLEWNDLAGALENVEIGLQVGRQVKDLDALLEGYAIQARVFQALDRRKQAREAIQNAENQALETQSISCVLEARAQRAYLALIDGDLDEAQRWATNRGLGQEQIAKLDPPLGEIESFSWGRLLMATGKSSQALAIFRHLISTQEQMGRVRALIESLVIQALCLRSLGHKDEAMRTIARALLLAEPEGFTRVFIQEGPSMAALLRLAGAQGHSPEYVKRLLESSGTTPTAQEAVLDPLSERELEVLILVTQGLTNTEIATELVIALSTVKTHINRIYSKLGVSTRTQAVALARQLQILP